MRVGLSTSVVQRGQTGISRYVISLVRSFIENSADAAQSPWECSSTFSRFGENPAWSPGFSRSEPPDLDIILFVLQEDLPLFEFARDRATIVSVPERYRSPARDILWHQTILPRLAREHRLDILHVPSYRRMLWRRPRLDSRLQPVPRCALVATIHDLAPFHVKGKYDWKRTVYGRVVARFLARRQSAIIAVSHSTARDLQRFFAVPPERITVIHNGIDHERFRPALDSQATREACARRYGLSTPFFLYVARLEHPGKNHLRLIEAFNQFKLQTGSPWKLALGGGDWHGADAIHTAIAQSTYAADIHRLGFVAEAQLPELYAAAEAFVYPSLFEGFGLPPLEAMACGCPVVCSTRGSLGEVVGDAALTIDPEDIDQIRLALTRIATDDQLRDRLRHVGIDTAKQFTWASCARATLDVYDRSISSAFSFAPSRVALRSSH